MAHETPTIEATKRDSIGTRYSRRLRNHGRLPGVIYGHKTDPVAISVDEKQILEILHDGAHVINVDVDGAASETCLVKDLQFGWLGDNVIHIDFARVDLDEEVTVLVHLRFAGELPAGKAAGAIVRHDMTDLEIVCKVNAIPGEIVVDQSKYEGNSIHVEDLELPPGVRANASPSALVLSVSFVHAEDEGEAADVATDGAEPEVITESKSDGEEG